MLDFFIQALLLPLPSSCSPAFRFSGFPILRSGVVFEAAAYLPARTTRRCAGEVRRVPPSEIVAGPPKGLVQARRATSTNSAVCIERGLIEAAQEDLSADPPAPKKADRKNTRDDALIVDDDDCRISTANCAPSLSPRTNLSFRWRFFLREELSQAGALTLRPGDPSLGYGGAPAHRFPRGLREELRPDNIRSSIMTRIDASRFSWFKPDWQRAPIRRSISALAALAIAAPPPSPGDTLAPPRTPHAPHASLKQATPGKCRPLPARAKVNFDFKGDIKELIQTISETTCKSFILTSNVRSQKFKILSPIPITVDEAWRVFLSALEVNNFSLVQVGRYYKVIPSTDSTRSPVPIYEGPDTAPVQDQMMTVISKLKHGGDARKIVDYLNIFRSEDGRIHRFEASNTSIATDYGTSIARLERLLREIDGPGTLERIHVVPVEFASATEIAEKLSQVFEPSAAGEDRGRIQAAEPRTSTQGGRAGGSVRETAEAQAEMKASVSKILADERSNKLIIVASESSFRQIMELKRALDIPDASTDGQIHVLRLKHAKAEELASTLANLAQGRSGAQRRSTTRGSRSRPDGQDQGAALFRGAVKVTADKATNSLVITASKRDLASVQRVVERLDVARLQVLVEATILEVLVGRERRFGVGAHAIPSPVIRGESSPFVVANAPDQSLSSLLALVDPEGLAARPGFSGALGGPISEPTKALIAGGLPSFGVIFQALHASDDVNVISTPHLLTMDNEEAQIQVAERRPFPSGLTLNGLGALAGLGALVRETSGQARQSLGNLGGLGLGQGSINREDIGLTLKVTPQINDEEDYIKLEIYQELSEVAGVDAVTQQAVTNKRAANTTVVVRNRDSVIIGGLVRERETIDEGKMPFLGDIPLLGWLFKQRRKKLESAKLVLILTPYIIRGPEDFRKIFERKMQERKEVVRRFYETTDEYHRLTGRAPHGGVRRP